MNTRQPMPTNILCRTNFIITVLALFLLVSASPAAAQMPTADFIDWDLPNLAGPGQCPSAIGAVTLPPTGDPVYYVTRCPGTSPNPSNNGRIGPSLLRFVPNADLAHGTASWRAWNLGDIIDSNVGENLGPTGGMKITRDESVAFVRGSTQIIRVKMNASTQNLTRWNDVLLNLDPNSTSDLALVERCGGYIDIYTTHDANGGVVQRLTVQNGGTTATVKRWAVGGDAGAEFLGGIAYFSGNGKVYFSETSSNSIGELDPNTNKVRHWSLTPVLAAMPRQISIDTKGVIWVITGSGHLVSLNPCTNGMASYLIPAGTMGSFGLGTSGGTVGFTQGDTNMVGMLIPNKPPVPVTPTPLTPVTPDSSTIIGTTETVYKDTGTVNPILTENVPAVQTSVDGEFVQAMLPREGNFPLGIFRDVERCVGNFYLMVALGASPTDPGNNHRLTHVAFDLAPVTSGGFVTGGGTIKDVDPLAVNDILADPDDWSPNSKANFGFVAYRQFANGPVKGNFNYQNHTTGEDVKSVAITNLSISGNTATFSGTCTKKQNGLETPCTFNVTVQDNGNPGTGKDTFQINGLVITPNGDTLNGGNIKIHQ